MKDAMIRAVTENANQYARSAGHPALVQYLASYYSKQLGREVNWETEVTVGVGATETLYAIMHTLIEPGDEIVLISPAFDIYSAQVLLAGGKPVYVPLRLKEDEATGKNSECWRSMGMWRGREAERESWSLCQFHPTPLHPSSFLTLFLPSLPPLQAGSWTWLSCVLPSQRRPVLCFSTPLTTPQARC